MSNLGLFLKPYLHSGRFKEKTWDWVFVWIDPNKNTGTLSELVILVSSPLAIPIFQLLFKTLTITLSGHQLDQSVSTSHEKKWRSVPASTTKDAFLGIGKVGIAQVGWSVEGLGNCHVTIAWSDWSFVCLLMIAFCFFYFCFWINITLAPRSFLIAYVLTCWLHRALHNPHCMKSGNPILQNTSN